MFYEFNKAGVFVGTTEAKNNFSTDVPPPSDDSKQWVWNGLNWVGVKKNVKFSERPLTTFSAFNIEETVEEPVAEEPAAEPVAP